MKKCLRSDLKCIDCYDVNEISENIEEIASNYDSVLKTMGEVML